MDLKKLTLPGDHIPLLRRNKLFSGLCLWMTTSLILLSLFLLTTSSFKHSLVGPFFQGVKTVNSSWPFSFPSSYTSVSNKGAQNNVVSVVLEKTHFSDKGKYGNFSGEQAEFNGTQVGADGKNGSFSGEQAEFNSTQLGEKCKNISFSEEGFGLKCNHSQIGKFSSDSGVSVIGNVNVSANNDNSVTKSEVGDVNMIRNESVESVGSVEVTRMDFDRNVVSLEECDIFDGNWVRDDSKPYYRAGSCPYVDRDFNCQVNGRPDGDYVKWKWQPNGCNIPSLNATDFLERLRGQKLVFVGDSLNRNMWESLVCILRQSVRNKKTVFEISGKTEFKKKGFYAFMFEDYNCTIDFVASPFLVRESSFKDSNGTIETLRLDLMDKTTSMYHDADIIIFNTGHWWTHEKTSRGENYYQEGNHVYPRLKVMNAYKRALLTWARWVDKNIDFNRTLVFFRGYSVTHFRGGQWNSGGQCHKETEPIFNPAYLSKYPGKMKVFQNVLQEMHSPVTYLNISRLTDYRKDGHPSIYRMKYNTEEEQTAAEKAQDCSHWCLPGVPDTWNELLYASLLKVRRGSWRD